MISVTDETQKKGLKERMGDRFKQMRNYVGISQKEAAAVFGMNQSNIARIESGIVSPNMSICHYFKTHYSINTNWLISGVGEMVIEEDTPTIDHDEFEEEVKDLKFHLNHIPEVRLSVLKFFVEYKLENKKNIIAYLRHQTAAEG